MLDVVDGTDRVLLRASRRRIHDDYLIHRSVIYFLLDDDDRSYVNQRSQTKDLYPGHWSVALGGHVLAGETYEEAAKRELEEETGLRLTPFFIKAFQKRTPDERENVRVYGVRTNQEPTPNPDEIEQGHFATLAEINEMLGRFDFLPETPTLVQILVDYTSRRI